MVNTHHFRVRLFGNDCDGAISVMANDDGTMTVVLSAGAISQSMKMSREDCEAIGLILVNNVTIV